MRKVGSGFWRDVWELFKPYWFSQDSAVSRVALDPLHHHREGHLAAAAARHCRADAGHGVHGGAVQRVAEPASTTHCRTRTRLSSSTSF